MSHRYGMLAGYLLALPCLVACGGSGDDMFSVGVTNTPGSGTAYSFVPPVTGSSRIYAETIVDNSNNTIDIGYSVTVMTVASNGVITENDQSTTGPGALVNGTNYSVPTETITFNDFGRETGYTYTESDGSEGSCSYSAYDGGPEPPLTVGQTWQDDYTETCNANAAIDYSQQGSVVDVESVTVPAGTFMTLKLQSTTTWTDLKGTTRTETATNWLDIATFHSVKQSQSYVLGGTLPTNGYAVSREIELQSST